MSRVMTREDVEHSVEAGKVMASHYGVDDDEEMIDLRTTALAAMDERDALAREVERLRAAVRAAWHEGYASRHYEDRGEARPRESSRARVASVSP